MKGTEMSKLKQKTHTDKSAYVETWTRSTLRDLWTVERRYSFYAMRVLARQPVSPKSIPTPGCCIQFVKELSQTDTYVVISASVC